ncbi:hypothetical protein NPIL_34601, partial [Nephila pilipes]
SCRSNFPVGILVRNPLGGHPRALRANAKVDNSFHRGQLQD